MEANILNNSDPEVWGYLSLVCLRTARKVEAEQSYKHAVKVRFCRRFMVYTVCLCWLKEKLNNTISFILTCCYRN